MSKISDHCIGTKNGIQQLIPWVEAGKYRYYDSFSHEKQLEHAKAIARLKDEKAREMCMDLLELAGQLEKRLVEAGREFETLHKVLVKIDADLDGQNAIEHPTAGAAGGTQVEASNQK